MYTPKSYLSCTLQFYIKFYKKLFGNTEYSYDTFYVIDIYNPNPNDGEGNLTKNEVISEFPGVSEKQLNAVPYDGSVVKIGEYYIHREQKILKEGWDIKLKNDINSILDSYVNT